MIVPSRWMKGGKGLDSFRNTMMNDKQIKYIYDFEDAKECFPGIHIDGGVNYFLWESGYNGTVEYHYKSLDGEQNCSSRYLNNGITETVVRDYRQLSIIAKALKGNKKFSEIASYRNPYGYFSDLFNNSQKYPRTYLSMERIDHYIKVYGVKGKKVEQKELSAMFLLIV